MLKRLEPSEVGTREDKMDDDLNQKIEAACGLLEEHGAVVTRARSVKYYIVEALNGEIDRITGAAGVDKRSGSFIELRKKLPTAVHRGLANPSDLNTTASTAVARLTRLFRAWRLVSRFTSYRSIGAKTTGRNGVCGRTRMSEERGGRLRYGRGTGGPSAAGCGEARLLGCPGRTRWSIERTAN